MVSAPPLRSQGRDHRLHGGNTGIQYHIEASVSAADSTASPAAAVNSPRADNESVISTPKNLERPRPIDWDKEKGNSRASSQLQRPSSDSPPAGFAAVARVPPPEKKAIKILNANMMSLMESKFGQKAVESNPHAIILLANCKLRLHTNQVIKHRASFIKASLTIDSNLSRKVENVIPKNQLGEKTKRPDVIQRMLQMYRVLYQCLQYTEFELGSKVEEATCVFFDMLDSNAKDCCLDKEREKEKRSTDRFGKSYKLSTQKLNRGYLKDGGKALTRNDGFGTVVKNCPK
eukprot:scaffold366988_cov66-Cyclotella_meneghiniana.AAC.1